MATLTKGKTFTSGETVTPTKLHELVDLGTVTNIAVADLAAATTERLLPAGAVMPFAMNSAPSGWLAANGDAVSRSTYAALFAAIGTTHGSGDGSTTFNLPDLRGYFVRGSGVNSDGVAAGSFGAKQAQAIQSHNHGVTDPGHNHFPAVADYFGNGGSYTGGGIAGTTINGTGAQRATATATTGISINNAGGTETRPANIALLYCIKF